MLVKSQDNENENDNSQNNQSESNTEINTNNNSNSNSNSFNNPNIDIKVNRSIVLYNKTIEKIKMWIESLKYSHEKKKFMVTPCTHAFHTPCLEKWMELKNECPYCRRPIPSLE